MGKELNLKEACRNFLFAADIFARIQSEAKSLNSAERGCDFSEPYLSMCIEIMKAHAHYSLFESAKKATGGNILLLSKLAMQTSLHFEKANSYASVLSKVLDQKKFICLLFNHYFFRAQAYHYMSAIHSKGSNTKVPEIGSALCYIRKSQEVLGNVKKIEGLLTADMVYSFQFTAHKLAEKEALYLDQNNRIYHQPIPTLVNEIQSSEYTEKGELPLISQLEGSFEGEEIFAKLGSILKKNNGEEAKADTSIHKHSVDDIYEAIKQHKERADVIFMGYQINSIQKTYQDNKTKLINLGSQLIFEEEDDNKCREIYGALWGRTRSCELNSTKKMSIQNMVDTMAQSKRTQEEIASRVEVLKEYYPLLNQDKAAVEQLINARRHILAQAHSPVQETYPATGKIVSDPYTEVMSLSYHLLDIA